MIECFNYFHIFVTLVVLAVIPLAGIYFKDDGKDAWEELEAQALCHSLAYNREEPAGPSVSFSGRLGPRSRVWALLQWPGQRPGRGQQLRTGGKSMLCNRLWSLASSFSPARLTEKKSCVESGRCIDRKLQITAA